MNVKKDFVLREIAGDLLLVPTGKTALDLNGMMTLNDVGADIWRMLPEVKDEEEIVQRLLKDYEATAEEIRPDVTAFLNKLRELNIL